MGKFRWKMELRAIGGGPRSSWLYDGATRYAKACPLMSENRVIGWYWVTGWGSEVPYKNTRGEPAASESEAKAQAKEFVVCHLKFI